jgi:hypothetical protein
MVIHLIRSFIQRTRRASLWNSALDAYDRGKTTESIALINRMQEISPLSHYHLAFLGTAYILAKDTLKARKFLQLAKTNTDNSEHPDGRYVNTYARLYLKLIDTDAPINDLVDEALSINCRPSLKRWLPVNAAKKPTA